MTKKTTTCFWYDTQAEDAVKYYAKIFKGLKIKKVMRYPQEVPGRGGQVLTISFRMLGQDFVALNGGPHYQFTPAISFVLDCKTQKEVDYFWNKLTADGGKEIQCGWLVDKFGLSWQVVPVQLMKYMGDKNPRKSAAVTGAMMQMVKLDIKKLKAAYDSAK